ncbi:MAG TPA: N-acetylneuraminate synthase family protein [Tepidisphaeraceae bacterium]|nr:N-acetylneuraminate synthase family protein [Tepidisphaeraceae bacterium]
MRIQNKSIGAGHPTFVIAEIGVNHDGSVSRALELVDIAAAAGADAVKLQLFRADRLMHVSAAFAAYQADRVVDADPAAMLRRYELSDADAAMVVDAVRRKGLLPIATPFSLDDVAAIARFDLPAVKVASPDLVNRPLLQRIAATKRPMLLSTGAAQMSEVATAVEWLRRASAAFALLHCVSSYPTPAADTNLCWIAELAQFAAPVGYSDHTTDVLSGALAVAAGACVVEKHLTYDRAAAGPDHAASADPNQFTEYVSLVRRAEVLRGSAGKRVLDVEQDVRRVSRQSLVTARAIEAGQPITDADLTVQRPGTGIAAADWPLAVGKTAKIPIAAGTMLSWDMLAA